MDSRKKIVKNEREMIRKENELKSFIIPSIDFFNYNLNDVNITLKKAL